jgi:3-hydroxybutyryl-CoA dehydrogenase
MSFYQLDEIRHVYVVGGGVMGSGIALTAALAGYQVTVFDLLETVLAKARKSNEDFTAKSVEKGVLTAEKREQVLSSVQYVDKLNASDAQLVIEALPEKLALKQLLFEQLEAQCQQRTILLTNTSSLSVSLIGSKLQHPARFGGLHFFNPATILKLVEVVAAEATHPELPALLVAFSKKLGKTPALVADIPGFIVNRVARFYYLESLRALQVGAADHEKIDRLLEATGFRMGPFKLMDLIGIDTNQEVTRSMYNAFFQEPRFRPSHLQQRKVDAGQLGRKSGRGFYQY